MVTWLPQSNAMLLSIQGGGSSEDYDYVAGADTVKWSGEADAYVTEKIITQMAANGGGLNKEKDTRLIIPGDLQPSVDITPGDTVTYLYRGSTYTRPVVDYDAAVMPGIRLTTVRLHLQQALAESAP